MSSGLAVELPLTLSEVFGAYGLITNFETLAKEIDSISSVDIFSKIIITKLNDKMHSLETLSSMFSNKSQIEIVNNPDLAIKNTFKNIQKNDLLAIIGSHYWGEYIYKNF